MVGSNAKLIKAKDKLEQKRPAANIVIGGADMSDLPNKQDLINSHLEEAKESAERQADLLIQDAQKKAQALIDQVNEEAKQIKLNAYEEGFASGKNEAIMIIKEEFQESLGNANKVLESIEKERQECLEDEESRIYKTVVLIAKHLLKKDLSLNPELSMEFITEAIKKLESKAELKISLDTETAQNLHVARNELLEKIPGLEKITVLANADLKSGDMLLESNKERLDLRLDTQLEELAKEILK